MDTALAFTHRLAALLRDERAALADFLVALADFDARRLWAELGHSSLFYFLHRELGLSKGAAFYRMTAAGLIRSYPEIVEPLRDGRLCLSSIAELSNAITPENRHEVLPRFFNVSKAEAKAVAAAIAPAPVVPARSVVTTVRAPALALDLAAPAPAEPKRDEHVGTKSVHLENQSDELCRATRTPTVKPARRAEVEPLSADLARIHVTVPLRLVQKLEAARDALSHAKPNATDADVLEAALDLVLAQAEKRKGVTHRPLKTPRRSKGDHIPAHVKRAVWKRDGGRCQWELKTGGILGSTHQPEFDHRLAEALGGPPTIENLRILCDFTTRNGLGRRSATRSWTGTPGRCAARAFARGPTPRLRARRLDRRKARARAAPDEGGARCHAP